MSPEFHKHYMIKHFNLLNTKIEKRYNTITALFMYEKLVTYYKWNNIRTKIKLLK